jgi:hypothetical protein
MIAALAVVGRDNAPIYVKTYQGGPTLDDIKFHFIVHTSLDSFDEKLAPSSSTPSSSAPSSSQALQTPSKAKKERYLGLLFPTESYRVYGYATVSLVKLILVLNDLSNAKDQEIRNFFTKFHSLYTDATCNAFYTVGDTITSKVFEKKLAALASTGL